MEEKIKSLARSLALRNAAQFGGKANPKAVLGSLLGQMPEARKDVPKVIQIIDKIIEDINRMTPEQIQSEIKKTGISTEKEKKEKETLKDLPNAEEGKVVMRFAPNPNGPLSLGHSRQALLNWFYVQKYKGRFVLRLDDTDPKVKVPIKEAYTWIKDDLKWLGIKPDMMVNASDRFDIYYDNAKKLIEMGKAYVCTCDAETFRDLKKNAKACPCRDLKESEQLARWEKMFNSYKEGEAVLRIKTDIKHKNPAIRDWPAFRIVDDPKHPLVDYRVWPLYDFASAIDDHLLGITHMIRGIDFIATKEKQGYLYSYFGWKYPEDIQTGKLLVEGIKSTSASRKMIESGELDGWDDPRLGTLMALRKRGFSPEAIRDFIEEVGVKKSDIKVSEKNLYSYNKKIIDPISPRCFFVEDPVEIDFSASAHASTTLKMTSPIKSQKDREIKIGTRILIAKNDFEKYKGMRIRLKELSCGTLDKKYVPDKNEDEYKDETSKIQVIQWVPKEESVDIDLIMPDNSVHKGKAESYLSKIKDTTVQFERVGFVNLIHGKKTIRAYFAHP